jgi:hypothetical protein
MAEDRVLYSRPCSLQNQDKSYSDGTVYVFATLARFMPRAAGGQRLELPVSDIKGAPPPPPSHAGYSKITTRHISGCYLLPYLPQVYGTATRVMHDCSGQKHPEHLLLLLLLPPPYMVQVKSDQRQILF